MSFLSKVGVAASIIELGVKKLLLQWIKTSTIAAAGSTQATATRVTDTRTFVTGADGSKGVILPVAEVDMEVTIVNTASSDLAVYPAVNGTINSASANAAFTQLASSERTYRCDVNGHWYVASGNLTGSSVAASANAAGAGFSGGTGTIVKNSVERKGNIIVTEFLFDLTGLGSSTTDLDIIGTGSSPAYAALIDATLQGTNFGGVLTCLEAPAGGVTDIDLYYATEGTGVFDAAVSGLTSAALVTSGGAWTAGTSKAIADPASLAGKYLYFTGGAGGTAGTYTAGKFRLTLFGY